MKTVSNVYLIGFALTICIVINSGTASTLRSKPRTTRGFKNAALSTARGFGKRDGAYQGAETLNDFLEDARRGYLGEVYKEAQESDSFPVDWFVNELTSNPQLARLIVKKFLDQNGDGELVPEELFRSTGY